MCRMTVANLLCAVFYMYINLPFYLSVIPCKLLISELHIYKFTLSFDLFFFYLYIKNSLVATVVCVSIYISLSLYLSVSNNRINFRVVGHFYFVSCLYLVVYDSQLKHFYFLFIVGATCVQTYRFYKTRKNKTDWFNENGQLEKQQKKEMSVRNTKTIALSLVDSKKINKSNKLLVMKN